MDTKYDWLGSHGTSGSTIAANGSAPPPVSFGFESDPALPAPTHSHYSFTNNSSDSISTHRSTSDSVPLSLQAHELSLEESKTYMRWYSDILARTNSRTISIYDVYQFLSNFKISPETKEKINRIFSKILGSINIGEFFALLRVVSHALQGKEPVRELIKQTTSAPVPPSILSKKRQNDENEDESNEEKDDPKESEQPATPLDIDSFTQFMLTGERPHEKANKKKSKKQKSVKFSDQVVTDIHHAYASEPPQNQSEQLDYSLPMDQLMSRINSSKTNLPVPSYDFKISSPDPEEKELLKDMEPQINHFRNLHSVDTISVDGVPSNIHLQENSDFSSPRANSPQPSLLQPNMTGPAQMASMGFTTTANESQLLRPNVTGPADMARVFAPTEGDLPKISLQSFTSQMTDDTLANTNQNARIGGVNDYKQAPPAPAARRARSFSQPNPILGSRGSDESVGETNGHTNYSYQFLQANSPSTNQGPPVPPRSPLGSTYRPKPPPPRSRRVSLSPSPVTNVYQTPPALPAKIPESAFYSNNESNSSTANILDDLKALQEEVDKIRDMTGGF